MIRAIKALKPLQGGFEIVKIGTRLMLQSVPRELNMDYFAVLEFCQVCALMKEIPMDYSGIWAAI